MKQTKPEDWQNSQNGGDVSSCYIYCYFLIIYLEHQSDTETRNLLDDVGDLDDEILDLEETKESSGLGKYSIL